MLTHVSWIISFSFGVVLLGETKSYLCYIYLILSEKRFSFNWFASASLPFVSQLREC